MPIQTNQSVSVDCALFGFDGVSLRVLLIERPAYNNLERMKLPGSMIHQNETLPQAAVRVLESLTGMKIHYLKQLEIFSDPWRVSGDELAWIRQRYQIQTERVVTVGYYALIKLDNRLYEHTSAKGAQWVSIDEIQRLAMDHKQILSVALGMLCREMQQSPIAFELLPRKFTIKELQRLFEAVLGIEIDNRNFRKKMFSSGFLSATGEKQTGVAHKPAEYFTFDKAAYRKAMKAKLKMGFIDNWRY
ncbi:MAG: NUDIX domain-containing protein [Alistipes sp.]|nr:NUDIX domain-containing protein [Alistipes sp.]